MRFKLAKLLIVQKVQEDGSIDKPRLVVKETMFEKLLPLLAAILLLAVGWLCGVMYK